jgi:hypothetical protein
VAELDQPFSLEKLERVPNGHDGDPKLAAEVTLGGQSGPRFPLSAVDALPQVPVDPEVVRDTPFEDVHSVLDD